MGTGAAFIPSRLQRGEPADVVIVADDSLLQLIKDGLVMADSRVELARSNIGMAVTRGRAQAGHQLGRGLQEQRSCRRNRLRTPPASAASTSQPNCSSASGSPIRSCRKSRRIDTERVGAVVARGDAEIGFQQIAELLPVPGIDFVGPLPPEVAEDHGVLGRHRHEITERECGSRADQVPGFSFGSRCDHEERNGAHRLQVMKGTPKGVPYEHGRSNGRHP